jgi:hypothetical protein
VRYLVHLLEERDALFLDGSQAYSSLLLRSWQLEQTTFPLFYFTALAIVRWFEWGVIQCSIPFPENAVHVFVHGGSQRGRVWRIIGILVSYLADLPFLIASGGFPRGRLFC